MDFDYKQFVEWLNGEGKEAEVNDRLLTEAKLSKYWKFRAARRAKNADRPWPNKVDRDWAIEQQSKSEAINDSIQAMFQNELEESEEMLKDASGMMRNIKKIRAKMKTEREAKLQNPKNRKNKKSLSKPYPPHKKGEGVSGYYKKVSKKFGGATAAPGEIVGPLEEEKDSE